ncbi:MAG: zinc-ribbon domain-containing protein [Oscillospiraceae bacterium]|nr:zinc-ribbon domain-containing protein [Oscillospiraceae bacterium]
MAIYCPNCGRQLPDNAVYCDGCGLRLDTVRQNTPAGPIPAQQGNYANAYVPQKKPRGGFFRALLALVIIGAIGAGVYYFFFAKKPISDLPVNLPALTSSGGSQTQQSTEVPVQEPASVPEQASVPESTPPAQEPATEPPQSVASTPASVPQDVPQGILTPSGNPTFDEFLFYENDVYNNGIPDSAALMSAGQINGQWKYCLIFNRTIEGEERIDEIGLSEVSFSGDTATLILHPQMIRYGSFVSPETDEEVGYPVFTGTWDNEYIDVSGGDIAIGIGPYWAYNGKEYSLGNLIVKSSGMFGELILIRP